MTVNARLLARCHVWGGLWMANRELALQPGRTNYPCLVSSGYKGLSLRLARRRQE